MPTYVSDSVIEWNVLTAGPAERLKAAWDYARCIFREPEAAAAWFGARSPAVLGGCCTIGQACTNSVGFIEAISELVRMASTGTPRPGAGTMAIQAPGGLVYAPVPS